MVAACGFFHGRLPSDTLAKNPTQAEDVAYSIASNAGCGSFDNDLPEESADSWQYGCTIGNVLIVIHVYGSDQARSQGLSELQKEDRPYVAKAYYAVTTLVTEAAGQNLTPATPPPASVLDPFR
jgi:hypothetical protein